MGRKDTIKGKKNMEVEDIMGYINGLSQQHKIFLHRTLATWRNLTGNFSLIPRAFRNKGNLLFISS